MSLQPQTAADQAATAESLENLFCNRCGSIRYVGEGSQWLCPRGCRDTTARHPVEDSLFEVTHQQRTRDLTVREEDEEFDPRPTTAASCPECGHDTTYGAEAQLRAADEAGTRLYTCTACEHTWRGDD